MTELPSEIRDKLKPSSRGVVSAPYDHTPKQLNDLSNVRLGHHANTDVKPPPGFDKQWNLVEGNHSYPCGMGRKNEVSGHNSISSSNGEVSRNINVNSSNGSDFRVESRISENTQAHDHLVSPLEKAQRSACPPKRQVITTRERVGDFVDSEQSSDAPDEDKLNVSCEIQQSERNQQMVKHKIEIDEQKVHESDTYIRGPTDEVEVAEEGLEFNKHLQRTNVHQKFVYFWLECDVFSQWYPSKFNVDGTEFKYAEQFMMYKKAEMFGDTDTAVKVLKSNNPRNMKQLGRQVKGFVYSFWECQCLYFVKQGNIAKFSQNKRLRDKLFETHPKILVEASPYDKIWGIGLYHNDPRSRDQRTWQGRNWLGYVLTEVRDELMYEANMIRENEKQVYIATLLADLESKREKVYNTI